MCLRHRRASHLQSLQNKFTLFGWAVTGTFSSQNQGFLRLARETPMKKLKRKLRASSQLKGLTPGIRMKGGVGFDPTANGFVAIVHTWDNPDCQGEPEEWCAPEIFSTEEAAMQYYKKSIRPSLKRMMTKIASKQSGTTFNHRKLEE